VRDPVNVLRVSELPQTLRRAKGLEKLGFRDKK
jgi:hypothetical protein